MDREGEIIINITFLVGNGFDLGCGLKSKYTDSYEEYVNMPSNSDAIARFKKNINSDYTTWSDFEMGMASYAKNFSTEEEFLDCFQDYSIFLNNYLEREQKRYFSEYYRLSSNKISEMHNQMKMSIMSFYEGTTHNTQYSIMQNIEEADSVQLSYINFNYTDLFEYFLSRVKNEIEFNQEICIKSKGASSNINGIHIHGRLSHDITLGVDNLEQITHLPYKLSYRGKCGFIKPFFNQEFDSYRVAKAKEYIHNSDIICILGMALGDSDLTWKNELVSWLEESNAHQLFYYDYEAMLKNNMLASDRIWLSINKRKKLCNCLGIDDNFFENQIYIPVGKLFYNLANFI